MSCSGQVTPPPGLTDNQLFLVITAGQDAFWCLWQPGCVLQEKWWLFTRGKCEIEDGVRVWKGAKRSTATHPSDFWPKKQRLGLCSSEALPALVNGKGRWKLKRQKGSMEYFLLLCWLWKAKKDSTTCDSSPDCKTFCYFSCESVVSRLSVWPHSNIAAKKDYTF